MIDAASDEKTFRRLGAISVLLGVCALLRVGLELYQARMLPAARGYALSVAFEVGLAHAVIVAGVGLIQRRPWVLPVAALASAAAFVHSAVALIEEVPAGIRVLLHLGANRDPELWAAFGSRILLAGAQTLFWPILLGHLYIDLQCREPNDPATHRGKRTIWAGAGAALLFCGAAELLLRRLSGR